MTEFDGGEDLVSEVVSDQEEEGMLSSFAKKRGALINLSLLALAIAGAVLILVLYLLFWIIDMDLLGDPEPVWAQVLWFAPQLALVLLLFQTIAYPMRRNPLQSPAVWSIVVGLIAVVFNVVASIFYFRLFWQCVTNLGSLEPIEDDICEHSKAELYTIAWFNFVFFFHALASIVICAWAYSKDLSRMSNLKARFDSIKGSVTERFNKLINRGELKEDLLSSLKIKSDDDKKFAHIIGSMISISPKSWNIKDNQYSSSYNDQRPPRRRGTYKGIV